MKKRFLSQDYFAYKKLGKKWRRPTGRHSKQRVGKGGNAPLPSVGFRAPRNIRGFVKGMEPVLIKNLNDLVKVGKENTAIISSGIGLKKAKAVAEKCKELGIRVFNTKKLKKALRIKKTEIKK